MNPVVGVAGMTHLGLITGTTLCAKGFDVVCYDTDPSVVASLQSGDLSVHEPGLEELLTANGTRQRFTSDVDALSACDVVYIAPDVPTDETGRSDLADVSALIDKVAASLGKTSTLVILCQVPPGFTRALTFDHARLYYQVETLVFGNAVERALRPERYIVGCADPMHPLEPAFKAVLERFDCPILPMRYESAELAKISINVCLVASISAANMMAELCEHTGADWHEIVPALRLDRRIGSYAYLKPGLGFAGGNLERDLATVIRLAGAHGTDAGPAEAGIRNSRHRRDWALRVVRENVLSDGGDPLIAIWGLAYKENTRSVKNSPALATIAGLSEVRLALHDPEVPADLVEHSRAVMADSALAAADGAEALLILTPWPEYREADLSEIARAMHGRTIIDPFGVLDSQSAELAGFDYHTLGMPAPKAER